MTGSAPQLWDAVSGTMHGVASTKNAETTTVPLEMPAFRVRVCDVLAWCSEAPAARSLRLCRWRWPEWQVSFEAGRGAPASTTMSELTDWSKNADPGYDTSLARPPTGMIFSDDCSRRWLDDSVDRPARDCDGACERQICRTIWALPYRLAIPSSLLHAGKNSIELQVTNLWPNRIIGDLQPGVSAGDAHQHSQVHGQSPLLPSGHLGRSH